MSEIWFFDLADDGNVHLRSRTEGDGGAVGDAFSVCRPGGYILNLPYEKLAAQKSGKILIENGVATIEGQVKLQAVDHDPFSRVDRHGR